MHHLHCPVTPRGDTPSTASVVCACVYNGYGIGELTQHLYRGNKNYIVKEFAHFPCVGSRSNPSSLLSHAPHSHARTYSDTILTPRANRYLFMASGECDNATECNHVPSRGTKLPKTVEKIGGPGGASAREGVSAPKSCCASAWHWPKTRCRVAYCRRQSAQVRFVVGAVRSAVASICGPENEKTVTVSGGGGASELELDAGVRVNGRVHLVPASACVYAHITGAVSGRGRG